MKMTIADVIRLEGKAEGLAIGKAQGKAEGLAEAKAEGKAEALHWVLLCIGRQRLGEPDTTTLQLLESITDVVHLERMSRLLLKAKSWAELLAAKN